MNKHEFINTLSEKTLLPMKKCEVINTILESHFLLGKQNKLNIINEIIEKLNMKEKDAEEIYSISITILKNALKDKIKHPFQQRN